MSSNARDGSEAFNKLIPELNLLNQGVCWKAYNLDKWLLCSDCGGKLDPLLHQEWPSSGDSMIEVQNTTILIKYNTYPYFRGRKKLEWFTEMIIGYKTYSWTDDSLSYHASWTHTPKGGVRSLSSIRSSSQDLGAAIAPSNWFLSVPN